jgi:hypothetical protein
MRPLRADLPIEVSRRRAGRRWDHLPTAEVQHKPGTADDSGLGDPCGSISRLPPGGRQRRRFTFTTTQPLPQTLELNGADDYMRGLVSAARFVVPGSLRIAASTGDERNAMLMLTHLVDFGSGKEADFGADARKGEWTLSVSAVPTRRQGQDRGRARNLLHDAELTGCGVSRGGTPARLTPNHSPSAAVATGCWHGSVSAHQRRSRTLRSARHRRGRRRRAIELVRTSFLQVGRP